MTIKEIIKRRSDLQDALRKSKREYVEKLRIQIESDEPQAHEESVATAWQNFQITQEETIKFDNARFEKVA